MTIYILVLERSMDGIAAVDAYRDLADARKAFVALYDSLKRDAEIDREEAFDPGEATPPESLDEELTLKQGVLDSFWLPDAYAGELHATELV